MADKRFLAEIRGIDAEEIAHTFTKLGVRDTGERPAAIEDRTVSRYILAAKDGVNPIERVIRDGLHAHVALIPMQ